MSKANYIKENIFEIKTLYDFKELSVEVFRYQYKNNGVYKKYVDLINCKPEHVRQVQDIPFLPIEFFKNHKIISSKKQEEIVFLSSGTTGTVQSKHYVTDTEIYKSSFIKSFNLFYGKPENYTILALLPNYLERGGSSLVFMVDELIKQSKDVNSGFYLYNHAELLHKITDLKNGNKKVLLIGVSYALLDLPVIDKTIFKNVVVLETGGMKGKRKETTKSELHHILREKFQVENIHSEYGMTELLSQAYSQGKGLFKSPPWMKILIRDTYDPFSYLPEGKSGGINIIDLANINSCAFIETKDIGKLSPNNQFEVLGRFDNSDIRGCNLMVN
jgi:phenylacetate-coenzyme A ligase PaaK-like adenylate-forming protein